MTSNKYLEKIAEMSTKEGDCTSPSNRYLEKIAEIQGLEKEAIWGAAIGAAIRGGTALARSPIGQRAIGAAGRFLSGKWGSLAGRATRTLDAGSSMAMRNLTSLGSRGMSSRGASMNASAWRNSWNAPRLSGPSPSLTAGLRNPAAGVRGAMASGVQRARNAVSSVATPGFRRKAMTANAVAGTAGNALMVKDLVTGAGSSASQQATQAATSSGQRAMAAAQRTQAPSGGWGGGNPGWNMQGANAF